VKCAFSLPFIHHRSWLSLSHVTIDVIAPIPIAPTFVKALSFSCEISMYDEEKHHAVGLLFPSHTVQALLPPVFPIHHESYLYVGVRTCAETCGPSQYGKKQSLKSSFSGLCHYQSLLSGSKCFRSRTTHPETSSMSYLWKTCANVSRSSIQARLIPRHMRGPREKGTSQLSRPGFSSQRSGRNEEGSGNSFLSKCKNVGLQDTTV
jgi:hypothetical protein